MASVQHAVLLLALAIAVQECQGKAGIIRCTLQPPCFDLLIMERMAQRVSNHVVKRCDRLFRKANQQEYLKIAEADMSAQEVAIFQIQKLNHANENVSEKPPPPVTSGKHTVDETYDKQCTVQTTDPAISKTAAKRQTETISDHE
ncbi:hypothetical protein Baya_0135 [Bagarius yarrelli]|uniref:Uncharacterized protein n=1 Tax=Bagarius yarrelli TaxID=175774 RepID=A0A556THE1_BAGYA|nr:hypothetical protein Baya_0135 [Bagarius yarrelli]